MTIAVGSTNSVKIECVKQAFSTMWPEETWDVQGVAVPSGIADQPMSYKECIKGGTNRAKRALKKFPADFGVGPEGGLQKIDGKWFETGWIVIIDQKGRIGIGSAFQIQLPPKMMEMIAQGKELGEVTDIIFNTVDSKQGDGFFGKMTNNHITRTKGYKDGVISALSRFLHPELYE